MRPPSRKINRRDFLKLALALPALPLAGKLKGLNSESQAARIPASDKQPNILVLVFDTLSAAHLPIFGYPRQTMPNISRFAERALVYHNHFATGNFTSPGTASILTGAYPWSHRAFHLHGTMRPEYTERSFFHLAAPGYHRLGYSHNMLVTSLLYQLRPDLETFYFSRELALADTQYSDHLFPEDYNASFWSESLIMRGWSTNPSSLFASQLYRLWKAWKERGLVQKYGADFPQGIASDNDVFYRLEDGINWGIERLGDLPQPFVTYLHFLPPHHPYYTRREFVGLFDDGYSPVNKPRNSFSEKGTTKKVLNQQRQAYDEYLAYADAEFGRLYDHLTQSGLLENTCLIFTSDHGEMFERGIWGHSTRVMYQPLLRVPLLISKPGQAGREDIKTPTSNVDLLPTLAHILGQPTPAWSEGRILPGFTGEEDKAERSLFAMEMKQNPEHAPLQIGSFVLVRWPYKLIHYRGYKDYSSEKDELYNLENDPEELENLAKVETEVARSLRQELEEKLQSVNQAYQSGN